MTSTHRLWRRSQPRVPLGTAASLRMEPTCIRRSVKFLSAVLLRRLERENGGTSTVEAEMWWMRWRAEAERRAEGGGGGRGGGGGGEEVGGGHGEEPKRGSEAGRA